MVPAGTSLREVLATSAVCRGEDGNVIGGGGAGAAGFEFGIDPEEDPDLALVRFYLFIYYFSVAKKKF